MNIKCVYHPYESITLTLDKFDPFNDQHQKVQQMLEGKKFVRETGFVWIRADFDETTKNQSFDFWLEQVTKLCQKFGGNEPVGIEKITEDDINKENESAIATDSLTFASIDSKRSKTLDSSKDTENIIQQLIRKIAQLEEEVDRLKKFDLTANEQLRSLQARQQGFTHNQSAK